ncbi:hypothetical protein [Sulfurospirillum cavolei]|uniref:hypothetical protein n=1 Tax=Sulfurospirillum cavolei TaxID=366522 RepID=UPI0005A84AF1|nr:hypothetical protein [Sulfurospirillum cavolei]
MQWLINFIAGLAVSFIEIVVKKFGIFVSISALIKVIVALYIAFLISAAAFITAYLLRIWNAFKDLFTQVTQASVDGSFGGVSNSQILSSSFAFLHDSGLADALITAGDLFVGLLSLYFVIQLYKLYKAITGNIVKIINDLFILMTR